MTRRLHNWTYRDVTAFLHENGFRYARPIKGSHEAWTKLGGEGKPDVTVEVNFTHGTYPVKTLRRMIYQSGIPEEEWIRWGNS